MPSGYDDRKRRDEQARRQRIMDGEWLEDAYQYLLERLGSKRAK